MDTATRRRWFQFGLRRMFASVAIIALGFAMIAQAGYLGYPGSAIAGAGVLLPIKRPILGALIGFIAIIVFLVVGISLYGFDDGLFP